MESGTTPSKIAEKYIYPKNTISAWLLPGIKEKIKSAFQSGEFSTKRKNVGSDKVRIWRMNNLPISRTILKEEVI